MARLLRHSSWILMIQFVSRPGLWCLNSSPSANLQFWSHQCPVTWSSSWTRSPKWSKHSCGSLENLTSRQQAFLWGWFNTLTPESTDYRCLLLASLLVSSWTNIVQSSLVSCGRFSGQFVPPNVQYVVDEAFVSLCQAFWLESVLLFDKYDPRYSPQWSHPLCVFQTDVKPMIIAE